MCIRDSIPIIVYYSTARMNFDNTAKVNSRKSNYEYSQFFACLLYTSDAADERSSVDLGGRRIIKKKTTDMLPWRGLWLIKIIVQSDNSGTQ